MIEELHAQFHGRVQGVGFRYTACALAKKLGLKGIVRNTNSASVELIAQGEKKALNTLLVKLESEFAIDRIEKSFAEPTTYFDGFSISH